MRHHSRLLDAVIGIGCVALVVAFVLGALAIYNKTFADTVDVTLRTGNLGNALQKGSDVKLNGVPVGRVKQIEAATDGAQLTLALDPGVTPLLPADTVARLLPKTLFGERYVALRPTDDRGDTLSAGDTIYQDSSQEAVELQEIFDQLLPMLQAIRPGKLSATLGELATMLRGQGQSIGDSMVQWADYLHKLNPLVPRMTADLAQFADVADSYNRAVPDLVSALDAMTVTSRTLVKKRTELSDLYANVATAAKKTRKFMKENSDTIVVLADSSRVALEALEPYAAEFPCLFSALRGYIPVMDENLGKGTEEPGMHVRLNVVPSRGKYLPGLDVPAFGPDSGPRCPYVTGQLGTTPIGTAATSPAVDDGTAGTPMATTEPPRIPAPPGDPLGEQFAAGAGLGKANSPGENQFVAELVAPTQGIAPADYPDWNSLLLGPTLRGTKVTLR